MVSECFKRSQGLFLKWVWVCFTRAGREEFHKGYWGFRRALLVGGIVKKLSWNAHEKPEVLWTFLLAIETTLKLNEIPLKFSGTPLKSSIRGLKHFWDRLFPITLWSSTWNPWNSLNNSLRPIKILLKPLKIIMKFFCNFPEVSEPSEISLRDRLSEPPIIVFKISSLHFQDFPVYLEKSLWNLVNETMPNQ